MFICVQEKNPFFACENKILVGSMINWDMFDNFGQDGNQLTRFHHLSSQKSLPDPKKPIFIYSTAKETRKYFTLKLIKNKICSIQEIYITRKTNCVKIKYVEF